MLRGTFEFQKSEVGVDTFKFNIINFILMITMFYNIFFWIYIPGVLGFLYFFLETQKLRVKKVWIPTLYIKHQKQIAWSTRAIYCNINVDK